MDLFLYNTLTRQKERFKPLEGKEISLYTCGPTVYDYDHLGHAWNYTAADLLRRTLEYNGYQIRHVLNITDVGHLESDANTGEDKIEKKAREQQKTAWEIADYYTKIYLANRRKLNLLEPHVLCKATDHITEMIALIKILLDRGLAYQIDDGIYFDVAKFPHYGQLSGNLPEQLKAGARVEINPQKHHPADFALWKFTPANSQRQMEWESPWGKGFPGWHIECSAMSMKYLGQTIDIHTGGEDNIFPHHESEIAQSEAATGQTFVRYWFHTRFLLVDGKKMSKSLNNFYTLADVESHSYSPLALRYLFLTAHYRTPLNFTWQSLESAQNALVRLQEIATTYSADSHAVGCPDYEDNFLDNINNDLDLPGAVATTWAMLKDTKYPARSKKQSLLKFDQVLGLGLAEFKEPPVPSEIEEIVNQREQARQAQNWPEADRLRADMEKNGYLVEDTPTGPKIRKNLA